MSIWAFLGYVLVGVLFSAVTGILSVIAVLLGEKLGEEVSEVYRDGWVSVKSATYIVLALICYALMGVLFAAIGQAAVNANCIIVGS